MAAGVGRKVAVLALLSATGCLWPSAEPWTDAQQDEAERLCRKEIGAPPFTVFLSESYTFRRFMCRCEVQFLSGRVPHEWLYQREHWDDLNRVLEVGKTTCLFRHKAGER